MAVGLQTFQITLDNPSDSFLPGETISGKLIIELGRTKSVRGVTLRFKGEGEVVWSERRGSGKSRHTTWYRANEEYFRTNVVLLRPADGSDNVEIAAGYHVFPFDFTLPRNIPNTFAVEHGHIRYSIKAIIDRPWKFDHETKIPFNVAAPFDLSADPQSMLSIDDDAQASFCCFPCIDMGSMNVHINIPTGGYAVGDPIEATIFINNNSSSVDVTSIKMILIQTISLHATTKTKHETQTVQRAEKRGPFMKQDEVLIGLQVPAVPSSNFLHTNLIDINYNLEVEICVSDCHCNTKRKLPIVIGHRLPPGFGLTASAHLIPAENGPMIQPIPPTAPVFENDDQKSFPDKTGSTPFPPNPMPSYGFGAANFPYLPTIPGSSGSAPFSATTLNPEKPPPSYNEVISTKK